MNPGQQTYSPGGPIAWMARNRVAANLLMAFLLIGGVLLGARVRQEVMPEFNLDVVSVSVLYRGASPEEVEQGILLSIEDEVRGIDGVKQITSTANEGTGAVRIELLAGTNPNKALQDIKNAVDSITSFPEEAERPIVSLVEFRNQVLSLIVHGNVEEVELRDFAERVRDELLQRKDITLVEMTDARPLEIAIEIPEATLRHYGLQLGEVSRIVRDTALELPGGGVKTASGEKLVRTQERRDYGLEFADIPVIAETDGSKVLLGEIAEIKDGFEETEQETLYNGEPAIRIGVYRVANETPISISDAVYEYLREIEPDLPPDISLSIQGDSSEVYRDRINLLLKNAFLGLSLVLLLLGLFLEPRLAFWVTLGIPISILGSFLFIPVTGASINMISLFAFIVTLGIVVDDAVVVGENIYEKREQGLPFLQAAIEGAREISVPVVFAVLTNVVAFSPLLFVPGASGNFFRQIPSVVIVVFLISLVESLYILPAHLAHKGRDTHFWRLLSMPQIAFEKIFHVFAEKVFRPVVVVTSSRRYLTFSMGLALLLLALGIVRGGHIPFNYFPRIDADDVTASAVLPFGAPIEESRRVRDRLLEALEEALEARGGGEIGQGVLATIGSSIGSIGGPPTPGGGSAVGTHMVSVHVSLIPSGQRTFGSRDFASDWRNRIGTIAGLESLTFQASTGPGSGNAIEIDFTHRDREIAEKAASEFADSLRGYAGVMDVDDGVAPGKPQYDFKLKPEGRQLGLSTASMAAQVRNAFFGSEAVRQQRGRNEVRVMVRLPREERERLSTLENLMLRTPRGGEIPLMEAATVDLGRSYTTIRRTEGRRVVTVSADVDETMGNENQIIENAEATLLAELMKRYPGLSYSLEGQQEQQAESMQALRIGLLLALLGIYTLLAIPFRSYLQPLVVMLSIPFGIIGAIGGHLLLGYALSMISVFGIIALTGVVVNDSLVLIVTTNRLRLDGLAAARAIEDAAVRRLRPIMLTSLTTFFGLAPMIFETSMQARFMIPMAISLGFGILFSTLVILLIVPSVYLILEDLRRVVDFVLRVESDENESEAASWET